MRVNRIINTSIYNNNTQMNGIPFPPQDGKPKENIEFKAFKIPNNEKQPKYLYNHVLDIINELKLPAIFSNDCIELPKFNSLLITKLHKLGIKFYNEPDKK